MIHTWLYLPKFLIYVKNFNEKPQEENVHP